MVTENNRQSASGVGEENDNWWQNDTIDQMGWAIGFMWAGIVLLIDIAFIESGTGWWDGWAVFFTGAGAISAVGAISRLVTGLNRSRFALHAIFSMVLLGIGLGDRVTWVWVPILILVGIGILRQITTNENSS